MNSAVLLAAVAAGLGIGNGSGAVAPQQTGGGQHGFGGGSGLTVTGVGVGGHKKPTRLFTTYVTGEAPGADVVFKVTFNPSVELSGEVGIAVVEPRGIPVDGIDFVPGTGRTEIVCGSPATLLTHYSVVDGTVFPDLIPFTDVIAVPPATPGTSPSTVWSSPSHAYYIENQFGFGGTSSHRIIRKPFGGGPEEVVYDGAVDGLINLEGIEVVFGRLYFFSADPGSVTSRALMSIGLAGGTWDGAPALLEIPGLFQDPFDTDGSDELDFDPARGLLFGTNIENGEIIAYDPLFGVEFVSPGSTHFIDDAAISASGGDLSLLGFAIDGIRSTGEGHLILSGKGGVILSIDIMGVLSDGPDDGDVIPLVFAPGVFSFDDLTPLH